MRTISIAEFSLFDAFGRDVDFHDLYPQTGYLDIETGDVTWIFEEDQDAEMAAGIDPGENQKFREKIDRSAKTYLVIPGRSHGENHEISQDFLKSNWTNDGELRKRVYGCILGSDWPMD